MPVLSCDEIKVLLPRRDAKEIISADVYGDTKEIIADCLDVLQPFIEEVLPDTKKSKHYDFSDVTIMNDIIMQLLPVA